VPIVQAYMLGVLPYSLVKVFAPAFFAVDRPRVPMFASMSSVAANLLFNGLTYRQLGAPGLALGTTVAALVNLSILRLWFGRILGKPSQPGWLRDLALMLVANAVLALVAFAAWEGARRGVAALPVPWPRGILRLIHGLVLLATIAVGFASYATCLRVLRVAGSDEVWELPRKLLRRFGRR
jgi:putative peptidoglycan lipid II flippase